MTIKYFAYGSNLHPGRLGERLGRCLTPERVGALHGYSLRFHKRSFKDGSGKCDAYKTLIPSDVVHGVIYSLSPDEKIELDSCEGLGLGYCEEEVRVRSSQAGGATWEEVTALTYIAAPSHIDAMLTPYDWYRDYVLSGAVYHGFPREYIEMIEGIKTVNDPDPARREAELDMAGRLGGRGRAAGQGRW